MKLQKKGDFVMKKIISNLLICSMLLALLSGCSFFDKTNEAGNQADNAGDGNNTNGSTEGGNTGGTTDGTSIHLAKEGIPTGVLSVPTRYIHTPCETANISDVNMSIDLVAKFITKDYFTK